MSRYIDIEPFIRVLEMSNTKIDGSQFANGYNDATIAILRALRAIPTADVAEARNGYWYIPEYEYLGCSQCGGWYFTGADSMAEAKKRLADGECYPYCPHCGANMDGERREK